MISAADYGQAVQDAILFLKGKSRPLLKKLKADMERAAASLDFERAASRDRMRAITQHPGTPGHGRPSFKDQDVLGLAQADGQALILVLLVRGGLLTGSRDYFFAELPPDGDLLGAFVKQYYAEGRPLPDEMLLPLEIPDQRLLELLLSEEKGAPVRLLVPQASERARLLDLAAANAQDAMQRRLFPPEPARNCGFAGTAEPRPNPPAPGMPGHLHPAGRAAGGFAGGLRERRPGQVRLPAFPHQRGGRPGRLRHAPGGDLAPLRQGGPDPAGPPAGGGRRPGAVKHGTWRP